MNVCTITSKKPYHKPQLVSYGDLGSITHTNQGGPNFDRGTPPRHKGPVTTGGLFSMDPSYRTDSHGEESESDIFEG